MRYLIMRPGAIGDNLLAFPVIQALRAQSNNPHVTFVGNAAVLPLALELGIAEEVSNFNALQWSELFATTGIHSAALQGLLRDMDNAICWLRDPEHLVERNLRTAGIQQVTIAPGRPSANERMHIVEYLARTLNLQWEGQDGGMQWAYKAHPHQHSGVQDEVIRVAIHPGSGGAYKCWPTVRFATLIEALWQRNIGVLLLAGPADVERLADLQQRLPEPPAASLLNTLVDVPLLTIAQQLGQCRGYVGNDSGITHLAALLATPTIALFGPSDPAIWRPWGNTTKVIYEPVLGNLATQTVLSAMENFFGI